MGNPLLAFWHLLFEHAGPEPPPPPLQTTHGSTAVFLVLRRMRAPLIVLIVIFAVSVVGLTLVPGRDADGRPWRMALFDAFYVMSYTATTIGFGEIPQPFSPAQRLWVTASIYVTVIGWAYAIGTLLALLQDRGFRRALAVQRFRRQVHRLREPFLLLAGYGQTGELLAGALDALGRRLVVLDRAPHRIDALELASHHADVHGLAADAGNLENLSSAGLEHPWCEGVLALTDDDETNLAVVVAAALRRPGLNVIARTSSQAIADRMRAVGSPSVVDPYDRFGDHLRVALRAPASSQLMTWLGSPPGTRLPPRGEPPARGRWVVCGDGRFGHELTADLRAEGLDVTAVERDRTATPEADLLAQADVAHAVGVVAATGDDTANLSLVAAARQAHPAVFVAVRQNDPSNAPLFAALDVDSVLVPAELVARETLVQLSTPTLWRFLQEVPGQPDAWSAALVGRLASQCGRRSPALWTLRLDQQQAPVLGDWLATGTARLGDLLRSPRDRDVHLPAVPLMVSRDGRVVLGPGDDFNLAAGDEVLLAGRSSARRELESTLTAEATREYVLAGRHIPSSWFWRRLSRTGRGAEAVRGARERVGATASTSTEDAMADHVASAETEVSAPPERVWAALTDPDQVAEYMFGTRLTTDWRVGSSITWAGEYEGRAYEDHGEVVEVVPPRRLVFTHFSPLSGKEDLPENYHAVTCDLVPQGDRTRVVLSQDGNGSPEEARHSSENWAMVLQGLKETVERG